MATSKRPNVIIVISDALRPKDLSLYGRSAVYDPFISGLSSECSVFMNNFSASNGSDPSVTSLFTGKSPLSHGLIHQHPFMREEEIALLKKNPFWLPLYLQQQGYDTFSATPLHLWFKKGFNRYTDKDSLKSGKLLDTPFMKRILLALPHWAYRLGKQMVKFRASPEFYPCTKVMDYSLSELERIEKPFFLFMHLVDSHYPYPIAPLKKIKGPTTVDSILKNIETVKQKEYIKKRFFDVGAHTMEQIELKRDESIAAVDAQMKRLFSFLKDKGLWENTLLFFLSDHGDTFGEHETYFCRGGMYDSSMHVPLIVHLPGVRPRVTEQITQTTDISATILDILGEKQYTLEGSSLVPLIKHNTKIHDAVYFADAFCDARYAVRTKTRKFVMSDSEPCYLCGARHHKDEKEMYDLSADPDELKRLTPDLHTEQLLTKFIAR